MFHFLSTVDEVEECLCVDGKVRFVRRGTTPCFGREDWMQRCVGKEIRWQGRGDNPLPFDGTPFVVLGSQRLECSMGPPRHKLPPATKYKKVQMSRKIGCRAVAVVTEIASFPDFSIISDTKNNRCLASQELRRALTNGIEGLNVEHKFACFVPDDSDHTAKHSLGVSTMRQPMDKRLTAKIHELVNAGIWRLADVRMKLDYFVRMELFAGQFPPPPTDTRFWPNAHTILCCVYRARVARSKLLAADADGNTTTVKTKNARNSLKQNNENIASENSQDNDSLDAESEDNADVNTDVDKESFRLVLPSEVVDLLPQVVPNSILHVNAVNQHGNALKLLCSLDSNGLMVLDFEGAKSSVFEMSERLVSIASILHPAYLVMNEDPSAPTCLTGDALTTEMQQETFNAALSLPMIDTQSTLDTVDSYVNLTNISGTLDVSTFSTDAVYGSEQPNDDQLINPDYMTEQHYNALNASCGSEVLDINTELVTRGSSKPCVECEYCCKLVPRGRIGTHNRLVHKVGVSNAPLTLSCVYCPRRFAEPQQLASHLKRHKGELLVACLLCHKTFVDDAIARSHMQHVHYTDYRYYCEKCAKGFWKNSALQQHDCTPSSCAANAQICLERTNKIAQLQQLNKQLYAITDPFGPMPSDEASDCYNHLCLICKKTFDNNLAFGVHYCAPHSPGEDREFRPNKVTLRFCALIPRLDDISEIIGGDYKSLEAYESDDEPSVRWFGIKKRKLIPVAKQPAGASKRQKKVVFRNWKKRQQNVSSLEHGCSEAAEHSTAGSSAHRKNQHSKEVSPSTSDTVIGVVKELQVSELSAAIQTDECLKDTEPGTVSSEANVDQNELLSNLQLQNAERKREQSSVMSLMPQIVAHGTRKRKICYVTLANGN